MEGYDTYQYIPLLKSLCKLLGDISILNQVEKCDQRISKNGQIHDFCDGTLYSAHPIFSRDPHALQIIAFYDELEICNPLGSHTKVHKLGMVFYSLGNIAPIYRSKLRHINLAIVATVPVIEKYGLNKILEPFISDLNILSSEGICIPASKHIYKGALLAFLADNLASNDLGGFKLSFSFSFRSCRSCLATQESFRKKFSSSDFELRTKPKHIEHLEKIKGPAAEHFSKAYGINRRSALLDVKYFPMFGGGLPHDTMHDVLEGLAPLEIKLLLRFYIDNNLFNLNYINDRILNFNYGYSEKDKPIPIVSSILHSNEKKLRSSASQMLTLVRILPFLIAIKISEGEEHWLCFLALRKIIDIVLCPVLTENLVSSLRLLVKEHHELFVRLYGHKALIPKAHFMTHYPDQILALGPMVCAWTIRHEAKLNFFKQASGLLNFKNVAMSLACRHQRWHCYEMASGRIADSPIQCGPPAEAGSGIVLLKHESQDFQFGICSIFPQLSEEASVYHTKWVNNNGILYKNNNVYVIIKSDGLDPVFGQLDNILVIGGNLVIFVLYICEVLFFDDHYHAYVVQATSRRSFISQLYDNNVYHGHKLANDLTYITLKYYFL